MDAAWRVEMLGGLRVWQGGRLIVGFRTRRAASLLAYLSYHPLMQSRESLIDWLWPTATLATGRNRLSVTLSSLRRQLEPPDAPRPLILANHAAVGLDFALVGTDVAEFKAALKRCDQMDEAPSLSEQRRLLERAADLYAGELLPGHYDDWIAPEQRWLAERFFQCVCRLARLSIASGQSSSDAQTLSHLLRAAALDPRREDVARALMLWHAQAGQPADALHHYHDLERALRPDFQAKPQLEPQPMPSAAMPSAATGQLASSIQGRLFSPPRAAAPIVLSPEPASCLALPLNGFFGRQAEMSLLTSWLSPTPEASGSSDASPEGWDAGSALRGVRLVTLSGGGGGGKTRLALEAAQASARRGGAVYFVPLAELWDARRIPEAIVEAMQLPCAPGADAPELIARAVGHKPVLLVLDNFEHLVPEGARVVQALLQRLPRLLCLVTSRRLLGLPDEREVPVPPLPLPQEPEAPQVLGEAPAHLLQQVGESEAVQMFVQRACVVRPEFGLSSGNAWAVARLCRMLQGVPLALELAAARALALSPEQIVAHLEAHSPLDFLRSRRESSQARHRSLRAVLDWSYRLLSPAERRVLRQLSVFRGGWTLEDASAVCRDDGRSKGARARGSAPGGWALEVLEVHEHLRECSLIGAQAAAGATRFGLLDTVREYAGEQLRAAATRASRLALEKRHARRFLELARAASQCRRVDQGRWTSEWLGRLEREHDNARAALRWSLQHDPSLALQLAGSLWWFWFAHGHLSEGRYWLAVALDRFDATHPTPDAKYLQHELDAQASAAVGSQELREQARQAAASLQVKIADSPEPKPKPKPEPKPEPKPKPKPKPEPEPHPGSGGAAHAEIGSKYLPAPEAVEGGMEEDRRALSWRAEALCGAGFLAWRQGDFARAEALSARSLSLCRQAGERHGIAYSIIVLQMTRLLHLDFETARSLAAECLQLCREDGDQSGQAFALHLLGNVAEFAGDCTQAASLQAQSLELFRVVGSREGMAYALLNLSGAARRCGDTERALSSCEASLALFRELSSREGTAYCGLYAALATQHDLSLQSEWPRAEQECRHSLRSLHALGALWGVARCLESLARFALRPTEIRPRQPERAVRLWSAAQALREQISAPVPPADQAAFGTFVDDLKAALQALDFEAAWQTGCALPLDQTLHDALSE